MLKHMSVSTGHFELRLFPAAVLIIAFTLTACEAPQQKAQRRADVAERAQHRMQEHHMPVPADPTHLQYDYAHPQYTVRQSFMWNPYGHEWRLMIVDYEARYAGFRVKRPYALPPRREAMVLYFEIIPPEAADTIAIGVMDDAVERHHHTPVLPIAPYRIKLRTRQDRHIYAIPLDAFDLHAVRISRDGTTAPADRAVDWDAVRGIHLHRLVQQPGHSRQVIIRNLQFSPVIWLREMQIEDHR